MTTRTTSLVSQALLARGFGGRGSDFEVYTGAAVADEGLDLPVVRMVGSSTVKDLQGDIMTITALQDMANGNPDLTIFLNHEYNVPDDVFGRLYGKPEIRMAGSIADLHLAAIADLSRDEPGRNPHTKAYDTYTQIKKGKIRLGSSVGCQVTAYQFLDPDDFWSGILIEHVVWVEHSIVGVPASQRAWVEQAVKGLFERSLLEGNADEVKRLAPAMKSMYWRDYDTVLRYLESDGLRKDLERVKERGAARERIMFDFTQNGFVLTGPKDAKKSLTIEDVDGLLEKTSPDLDRRDAIEEDDLDTTKGACGKTSWPLMGLSTEWTGSKAESAIFAYAKGDDGEITPSKAKQGFLYIDDSKDAKTKGAYKLPFCYGGDGGLKIVPLGVRAVANVLSGGRGGADLGGAEGAIKSKVKTMYGRINSEFNPDPKWVVPWEKDEKDIEPDMQKDIADSESDAALNRQDLGEVTIKADGSHEPFTGKHSHAHKAFGSQGDDDTHTHEHNHDGDANHGHSHAEKQEEPDVQKAGGGIHINDDGSHEKMTGLHTHSHPNYGTKADGSMHSHKHEHQDDADHHHAHDDGKSAEDEIDKQAGIKLDEDGSHEDFTGTHSHKHKAFSGPDKNDDGQHAHSHDHNGDSNHKHSHDGVEEKSTSPVTVKQDEVVTITPEQLVYLSMYNDIGKKLGFPEHTLLTKCDLVPTQGDAGIVRSTLAALDDCSDAMMSLAQRTDNYVDSLMGMLGVPDVNDKDEASSGGVASWMDTLASTHPQKTKEGRELSGANRQKLQAIHDTVASMHPDVCKSDGVSGDGTSHQDGSRTVAEAQEEARRMGQGDSYSNLSSFVSDALKASLTKALEGISTKAIIEQEVVSAVDTAMTDARSNLDTLRQEITVTMQHLAKLANMPLGRPTNLQRTVTPVSEHAIDNVATYEDMLAVAGITGPKQTLQEALAQTRVVAKEITTTTGQVVPSRFRHWPAGVGGTVGEGVRPPLSNNQKSLMHYHDWGVYNTGGEVDVPVIDDPAERL